MANKSKQNDEHACLSALPRRILSLLNLPNLETNCINFNFNTIFIRLCFCERTYIGRYMLQLWVLGFLADGEGALTFCLKMSKFNMKFCLEALLVEVEMAPLSMSKCSRFLYFMASPTCTPLPQVSYTYHRHIPFHRHPLVKQLLTEEEQSTIYK